MATFRHRKGKWQVQVRRRAMSTTSRTFALKADAMRWAKQTEAEMDREGIVPDRSILRRVTVADLFTRFRDEMCPSRPGRDNETIVINAFLRRELAQKRLADLTPVDFSIYRDQRLKDVKAGTVNRELGLFQRVFEITATEWKMPLANPVKAIRKPRADRPRERRLNTGEWGKLLEASRKSRNQLLLPLVRFALATGMRRGELLNAHWGDIEWKTSTLRIPHTKNGEPRTIPLSLEARLVLAELAYDWFDGALIFPLSEEAVKLGWKRLVKRAGIENLHFHDLRHEAISRFFEHGLSIPEVALISGHKDPRMLFRYTHLKAENIALKLAIVAEAWAK